MKAGEDVSGTIANAVVLSVHSVSVSVSPAFGVRGNARDRGNAPKDGAVDRNSGV